MIRNNYHYNIIIIIIIITIPTALRRQVRTDKKEISCRRDETQPLAVSDRRALDIAYIAATREK